MKVWKVQETIVNDDKALELELNRLERFGANIKEVILTRTWKTPAVLCSSYKIIYTEEDVLEADDEG